MTEPATAPRHFEQILGCTAFAAGAVDIISFAKLGGIFASAMTGNLAFLGFYLGRFAFTAAFGSLIALAGFIAGGAAGTLLSRGRVQAPSLKNLLGGESLLLAAAAVLWLQTTHRAGSLSCDGLIALLSLAMGLQSIIGKRINLSNIPTVVFTSTLTNIVIALTDSLASGRRTLSIDTRRQSVSFLLYFAGALLAGVAVFCNAPALIFMPLLPIAWSFWIQLRSR